MTRFNTLQSLLGIALCMTLTGAGLVGCSKEEGSDVPGGNDSKEVFNFSTRSTYTLNIQYQVPTGYEVYFEVYTENPLSTNEAGQQVKRTDLQPIDKGYTNDKGLYKKPIVVNAAVETLYIYTNYAGVPRLLTANVKNGILTAAALPERTSTPAAAQAGTRAADLVDLNYYENIKTLLFGKWIQHSDGYAQLPNIDWSILYGGQAKLWGRPAYLDYVDQSNFPDAAKGSAKVISAEILKTISTVLPGDGNGAVDPKILKSGDIHVTKDAEVDLYFIDEAGLYMNVLAYYCYPTNQPPTSVADINTQMIAFPNAKAIRSHFASMNEVYDYGSLRPGEGVRLHYIDQNGEDRGPRFPAGTSIGWILYANGYNGWFNNNDVVWMMGRCTKGEGAIYSAPELNVNSVPHMAVFRHGDFVVTAFEDSPQTSITAPCDYDDVVFHVASTPADAITPGIPDKDPEPAPDTDVTYRGILSFEDNWPYRGDFDMNDVVATYKSDVTLNKNNQVVQTVDTYTIVWSGATYNNSFAVENKNLAGTATVTLEGGDGTAKVEGNIIRVASSVLDYANLPQKKSLIVTTKFATPVAKENFIYPPYNPFITVKSDKTREVHLTNMQPTPNIGSSWLGYGHDFSKPEQGLYYITYDENGVQMPFAMDILFSSEADMGQYVIPAENKAIHQYYPGFLKWLQSGGTTNKDWYLYPAK